MAKRKDITPEEDILEWFARMDFGPEDMVDIWTARSALARQLEGTTQYPGTAAQMRAVDFVVREVYGPMYQAGVRPTMAWNVQGYWEVRYAVREARGLFGWERALGFITERTGITPKYTPIY